MEHDFNALWDALNRHPDYRGGVAWSRVDIETVANERGIDPDELDEVINFDGWEAMAVSNGFDWVIAPAVSAVAGKEN